MLDINCKAHELDNLYVLDSSFFVSIGAVNPTLTIIANALRVGDHLLEHLGAQDTAVKGMNGTLKQTIVPEMAVEEKQGCRFIPLADEGAYRRIGIAQLKRHFRSRVHRTFLEHLQSNCEPTHLRTA